MFSKTKLSNNSESESVLSHDVYSVIAFLHMDEDDREVLLKTLSSFAVYGPSLHSANQLRRTDYISLKQAHKDLLPQYLARLEEVDDAIALNAKLVDAMLQSGAQALLGETWSKQLSVVPAQGDLEKIRGTVKQIVRDWSIEVSFQRQHSERGHHLI